MRKAWQILLPNYQTANLNIYGDFMKKVNRDLTLMVSLLNSQRGRVFIFLLTVALFVLSAGAPAATIGIGK